MKLIDASTLSALILTSLLASGCAAQQAEVDSTDDDLTRAQCRGERGETEPTCRITGRVEQVLTTGLPSSLANKCVTLVDLGTRRIGLLQPTSACSGPSRVVGGATISFSKGAMTYLRGEKARVLKTVDGGATYYDFDGVLRTLGSVDLTAFDALDDEAKVSFLFQRSPNGSWARLHAEFTEKDIRFVDVLEGEALRHAMDEYTTLREFSLANGGDLPRVYAIQKQNVTFAYGMTASGRSFGNWGELKVFNRNFDELESFGYAD